MKTKVMILGGTGMIGSMLADFLTRDDNLEVTATARQSDQTEAFKNRLPEADWIVFDTSAIDFYQKFDVLDEQDWVINAISMGQPLIDEHNPFDIERAIWINALLPHLIARNTRERGVKLIHPAASEVFSGINSESTEQSRHNALGVYGKTRSLGEVPDDTIARLRCTMIGPEPHNARYLLQQLLNTPADGRMVGSSKRLWGGLTTLHFAKICHVIIQEKVAISGILHLTCGDETNLVDLMRLIAKAYGRTDLTIEDDPDSVHLGCVLKSDHAEQELALWNAAGYDSAPPIADMLDELAAFDFRLQQ